MTASLLRLQKCQKRLVAYIGDFDSLAPVGIVGKLLTRASWRTLMRLNAFCLRISVGDSDIHWPCEFNLDIQA
jgi:hypothetical protein